MTDYGRRAKDRVDDICKHSNSNSNTYSIQCSTNDHIHDAQHRVQYPSGGMAVFFNQWFSNRRSAAISLSSPFARFS
jgi:hypothetical protein